MREGTTQAVRRLGERLKSSVFMVLLAALGVLLRRYTGQEEVRIGVTAANRSRIETEGVIGFFVNTQVLSLEVRGRESFAEISRQARERVLEAQANAELPFEQLVGNAQAGA